MVILKTKSMELYKVLNYVPRDVIKMSDERRNGIGNPLKRDGSIDVTRLIFRICIASKSIKHNCYMDVNIIKILFRESKSVKIL